MTALLRRLLFSMAAVLTVAAPAAAQRRTVMEGLGVSHGIVLIDTATPRVLIGGTTVLGYTGGVPNTALYVSSNIVISTGPTGSNNFIILYATGSICLNGACVTTLTSGGGGGSASTGTLEVMVSSIDVVNVTTVSLTASVMNSSITCRVEFDVYLTSAVNLLAVFNNWVGNTAYQSAGTWAAATGVPGVYGNQSYNQYAIALNDDNGQTLVANNGAKGWIEWSTVYYSSVNVVAMTYLAGTTSAAASPYAVSAGVGGARLTNPPTSIQFILSTAASTSVPTRNAPISGHFELWCKGSRRS